MCPHFARTRPRSRAGLDRAAERCHGHSGVVAVATGWFDSDCSFTSLESMMHALMMLRHAQPTDDVAIDRSLAACACGIIAGNA